jgi:hypothetical protein
MKLQKSPVSCFFPSVLRQTIMIDASVTTSEYNVSL